MKMDLKVVIVEDDKLFRDDFKEACGNLGIACRSYSTPGSARNRMFKVPGRWLGRPDILFVDGSLSDPDGNDIAGLILAEEACQHPRLRGTCIWIYTKFINPNPKFQSMQSKVEVMVATYRARNRSDVQGERRLLNRTVAACSRDYASSALLKMGLTAFQRLR